MHHDEKESYALCPECGLVMRNDNHSSLMYCMRCGCTMLTACPSCNQSIRFAFAIYCDACGHKYVEKNAADKR